MEFNIENIKSQMRKGMLELCILAIISGEEKYPSDIIEELSEAKLLVVEGTLYPLLTRLKNAGLLTYSWAESSSGPPRKYYKLTSRGSKFLGELATQWKELEFSVNKTTKKIRKP